MKSYFLNGEINPESTEKFLNFLNDNEDIRIYLTSGGGQTYSSEVILDVINKRKDLELFAIGKICSNAFYIFFSAKCKRYILDGTHGMFHFGRCDYSLLENGKLYYDSEKFDFDQLKKQKSKTLKWCREIGMTGKEIRDLDKDDVFFTNERLNELLSYKK